MGCSNDKITYWCGDHPCINKSEREAYFKKTMIVEVKEFDKKKIKSNSEIEKVIQQALDKEKVRIKREKSLSKLEKLEKKREIQKKKILKKQAKLEEKRRLKEEKALAKQVEKDEKRKMKEEKSLSKQIKKDEKRKLKEEKILSKKMIKKVKKDKKVDKTSGNSLLPISNFQKIVKEINKRNFFKPYPDINDIPN